MKDQEPTSQLLQLTCFNSVITAHTTERAQHTCQPGIIWSISVLRWELLNTT